MADVFRVHPDHARFQTVGEPQRPRQVVGPDVAGQAVGNVIGDLKCFFFRTEADGGQDRAEDFFLGDFHRVVRAGEEGWAHEAAFRPDAAAASGYRCAVLAGGFEVAGHLVEMGLVDQRTDFGLWVEGMTDLDVVHPIDEPCLEFLGNRVLHQKARGRGAALSVERIDHEDCRIQRPVEIGIVENDHGVLAAELEMHPLQGFRPLSHDHGPGAALADEGDGLDVRMFCQGLAGFFAEAVDKVPDTFRQAGFFCYFHQDACSDWRKLRRLVDHGAACCERRRNLPGRQHERRVPGRDHTDRSDRKTRRDVHEGR